MESARAERGNFHTGGSIGKSSRAPWGGLIVENEKKRGAKFSNTA